jgi:hypothetical protein
VSTGRLAFYLGWNHENEQRDLLLAGETPFDHTQFRAASPLSEFDPRPAILPVKDQQQTSSCTGFSRAGAGETLNWIKTGGTVTRFSEMYCYDTAQRRSQPSTWGTDGGALIQGSVDACRLDGFALATAMPFTGKYVRDVPQEATTEGLAHLVKTYAHLDSYDACFQWMSLGLGVILIGIPVTDAFMQISGPGCVLDGSAFHGTVRGGHALYWCGFVAKKDNQGRNYFIMPNSWSPRWGDDGCCLVEPATADRICKSDKCEVWGISDLVAYEDASGRLDFTGVHG